MAEQATLLPLTEEVDRPTRFTERMMLDLLHDRYSRVQGNGPRYVCAEHVAAHTGWISPDRMYENPRRIDFMAQDTYSSGGWMLHGHEVKVSRSDWLCELRQPEKSAAIRRYCDRWWLVVPDVSIVRGDLPDEWGLLAIGSNGRLRVARRAPSLTPEPIPAAFRASLMRAVGKTAVRRAA